MVPIQFIKQSLFVPLNNVMAYLSLILYSQKNDIDFVLSEYRREVIRASAEASKGVAIDIPLLRYKDMSSNFPELINISIMGSVQFGVEGFLAHVNYTAALEPLLDKTQEMSEKLRSDNKLALSLLNKPAQLSASRLLLPVISENGIDVIRTWLRHHISRIETFTSGLYVDVPWASNWSLPSPFTYIGPGVSLILGGWGTGKSALARVIGSRGILTISHAEPTTDLLKEDYVVASPTALSTILMQVMSHRIGFVEYPSQYDDEEKTLIGSNPLLVIDSVSKFVYAYDDAAGPGGVSVRALAALADLNNLFERLGVALVLVINPDSSDLDQRRMSAIASAAFGKVSTTIVCTNFDTTTSKLSIDISTRRPGTENRNIRSSVLTIPNPDKLPADTAHTSFLHNY
jgi:hypothetical protein